MTQARQTESGNALWFILIGIVLLGALTVMLSRSSSTSEDTGDYEQMQIQATQVMRYAKGIGVGVQNLVSRGCSENEISFWYDSDGDGVEEVSDRFYNPKSPTDRSCHVFYREGAGITHKVPDPSWLATTGYKDDYVITEQCIAYVGTGDTSCATPNTDLMFQIIAVNTALCMAINDLAGIPNPAGAPPTEDHGGAIFAGSFTANASGAVALITSAQLDGKHSGCFTDSGGSLAGQHVFYHVVLPR